MRKITPLWQTAIMFCIVMIFSVQAFTQTATIPFIGDGSESNPYEIATLENLYWLTQNDTVWNKYFIQTANIDASASSGWDNDSGFTPIGNLITPFTGCYNGKRHTIDQVTINRLQSNNIGLFGYLNTNAHIDSLGLENVNIIGFQYVGGLAGNFYGGYITNCYSTGSVKCIFGNISSGSYIGGLVGKSKGNILSCYSSVNVSSSYSMVGGLVGLANSGTIMQCYSQGNVTGSNTVGGLLGNNSGCSVEYCYSRSWVVGNSYSCGGLIGVFSARYSFWDVETSGHTTSGGGVGLTTLEMQDSTNYLNAGWDFKNEILNGTNDIWGIDSRKNNGYPFLSWQKFSDECQSPVFTVRNIVFEDISINSINLDSIIKSGYNTSGYCIYINTEDSWVVPVDGTKPASNTSWQNTGQQCIYYGESNNLNITIKGLSESTRYYFKVYAYNDCSGTEKYEQNGIMVSQFTKTKVTIPDGDGSESNPYIIANYENLAWIMLSDTAWDKHYIQTANIDASLSINWGDGKGFIPIGNGSATFTGSYNGKGNVINGISINRVGENNIGLFGWLQDNARIENLGLTNLEVIGGTSVGGLVGSIYSDEIDACVITQCFSQGNVTGYSYVGGLVGRTSMGKIINCYTKGKVDANSAAGGLLGKGRDLIVQNCYSNPSVSATYSPGGVIGSTYNCSIENCFWDIDSSGQSSSMGGGIGLTTVEMKDFKPYLNAGWDFMDETINGTNDIWGHNSSENNGYPFLHWQGFTNTDCQVPLSSTCNIVFGTISVNSIKLESITNSGYGTKGYSVYINTEDKWSVPADGTEPVSNTSWQNNGQQCIYFGASNNPDITVTGLSEITKYYFNVYTYNDCSGTEMYEQTGTVISQFTDITVTKPDGGGSEDNPYIITNYNNLAWLMRNDIEWDKHYIQTVDIDVSSSVNWDNGRGCTPIGNAMRGFNGTYDGKGNIIDNVCINHPVDSLVGFFGYVHSDAHIENLGLSNIDIKGSKYVGGLAGYLYGGQIKNCYTTGICASNISDTWSAIGGLAGLNAGRISLCYSDVDVSSNYDMVGGLVGVNLDFITNSYSTGNVQGSSCVGGLVGLDFSFILNSYSRSSVNANTNICGGLIGDSYGYAVSCFWDTETSGQSTSIGGDGLFTADMQNSETYFNAGWDFMNERTNGTGDYWGLNSSENDGYPFLYWQGYTNTEIIPTDVNGIENTNISIYPNPVSEVLNITTTDEGINRLVITDINGKKIIEKNIDTGTEHIDMSSLNSGIYLINIYKGNDVFTSKIIKR